jgi:hypothetical protein
LANQSRVLFGLAATGDFFAFGRGFFDGALVMAGGLYRKGGGGASRRIML